MTATWPIALLSTYPTSASEIVTVNSLNVTCTSNLKAIGSRTNSRFRCTCVRPFSGHGLCLYATVVTAV